MRTLRTIVISAGLLVCVTAAFAASKVTVGVGHMCCGACKAAATAGLAKVAADVSIEADNITLSPKGDDLLPTLEALRKSGFPAKTLVVEGPVTLGVAHLCCNGCRNGLTKALTAAKLEDLDLDSVKVGEDSVTVKAKSGMKLDLIPLIAAMEKGGFSPSKITVGASAAHRLQSGSRRIATR